LRPTATIDEWLDYVASLVTGPWLRPLPAVGELRESKAASRAGFDGGRDHTDLGLGTAHIAQVAVDPDMRGRGWGRALVASAMAAAAAANYKRLTLLVAETNAPAAALYADLGFTDSLALHRRRPPRAAPPAQCRQPSRGGRDGLTTPCHKSFNTKGTKRTKGVWNRGVAGN